MEQDILPKRVKISIFLMLATGVLTFIQFIFIIGITNLALSQINDLEYNILSVILAKSEILLLSILFIIFSYFLNKKKKWAWFASMVILLKEAVVGIKTIPALFYSLFYIHILQLTEDMPQSISILIPTITIISILSYILVFISLIFLILERKNYWQIAS